MVRNTAGQDPEHEGALSDEGDAALAAALPESLTVSIELPAEQHEPPEDEEQVTLGAVVATPASVAPVTPASVGTVSIEVVSDMTHVADEEAEPTRETPVVPLPADDELYSRRDRKREVLHSYAVELGGRTVTPNPAEIAEARWVHRGALPEDTSPFTRRMVARAYWEYWTDPPDDL